MCALVSFLTEILILVHGHEQDKVDSPLFTHKYSVKHPVTRVLIFNIHLSLKGTVKQNIILRVI